MLKNSCPQPDRDGGSLTPSGLLLVCDVGAESNWIPSRDPVTAPNHCPFQYSLSLVPLITVSRIHRKQHIEGIRCSNDQETKTQGHICPFSLQCYSRRERFGFLKGDRDWRVVSCVFVRVCACVCSLTVHLPHWILLYSKHFIFSLKIQHEYQLQEPPRSCFYAFLSLSNCQLLNMPAQASRTPTKHGPYLDSELSKLYFQKK